MNNPVLKSRYIRVSHKDQQNLRQLALQHPDEKLFIDVISGAIPFSERPAAKQLLEAIQSQEINYISVSEISRLGRNAFDIQLTLELMERNEVTIRVDSLGNLESRVKNKTNPIFKMITDVLANVAQMERDSLKVRQKEGIKLAQALGKYKGRAKGTGKTDDEVLTEYKGVVKELKLGDNSLRKISKLCGVSLATVQKVKSILDKEKATD